MHIYKYIYIYIYIDIHECIYLHVSISVYLSIYISHVYTYISIYICIYTYTERVCVRERESQQLGYPEPRIQRHQIRLSESKQSRQYREGNLDRSVQVPAIATRNFDPLWKPNEQDLSFHPFPYEPKP